MKKLYRLGGAAPFITISLYLTQFAIMALTRETYPVTSEQWFALFNRSPFLGLIYINALDGFSIAILGLLFLALWAFFKRAHPSQATIAACFALIGVTIFVATRGIMVSGTLSLSGQYAQAASANQRSQILAAGTAVMSITRATPETFGFLFLAISGSLFSSLFLQSEVFENWLGYLGLGALVFTLMNDLSLIFFPAVAPILMIVNGVGWFVWWIFVGRVLSRLAGAAGDMPGEGYP
jgi:hypothetical protein